MLRIVIDASADMPPEWIEKYDLSILPMPIQIGGRTYYQGLDITNAQFYKLVQDKNMVPKSAAPSPLKISQIFESIYKAGDSILALTVSSKMSAPNAPNTGYVLVEIFYNYEHRLGLPWITAVVDNPMLIHTYAFMPLTSAEPTPTPVP